MEDGRIEKGTHIVRLQAQWYLSVNGLSDLCPQRDLLQSKNLNTNPPLPSPIFRNVIHSKNYLKIVKHSSPMVAEKEIAARWKRTFRFGRPTSEILDKHVEPESRSGHSSKSLPLSSGTGLIEIYC